MIIKTKLIENIKPSFLKTIISKRFYFDPRLKFYKYFRRLENRYKIGIDIKYYSIQNNIKNCKKV